MYSIAAEMEKGRHPPVPESRGRERLYKLLLFNFKQTNCAPKNSGKCNAAVKFCICLSFSWCLHRIVLQKRYKVSLFSYLCWWENTFCFEIKWDFHTFMAIGFLKVLSWLVILEHDDNVLMYIITLFLRNCSFIRLPENVMIDCCQLPSRKQKHFSATIFTFGTKTGWEEQLTIYGLESSEVEWMSLFI